MARNAEHSPSRPPLAIDPERENRVRERAYLLWEADGKPHGRDVEYWERARALISTGETAASVAPADPPSALNAPRKAAAHTGNHQQSASEPATSATPKRKARAAPKKPA
jgi:Protein of unknown function (DUF2934)